MTKQTTLGGVLTALVTPMTEGASSIDEAVMVELVERQIGAGVGGLIPCGSTGEFSALSHEERRRVAEIVVKAANGEVPVIPQTGALTTKETVELSLHAASIGSAAVMVVPPFYEAPSWRELVEHYRAVADAIEIPIMIYNIPSATGLHMTADQISDLAAIEGVEFLKSSTSDAVLLTEVLVTLSDKLTIFNGWDSLTFFGLAAGSAGTVWGAASFIPELAVALFDALVTKRDLAEGRRLWSVIWPICNILETSGAYASAVKAGCSLVGIEPGPPRPPLLPALPEVRERLRIALEAAAGD